MNTHQYSSKSKSTYSKNYALIKTPKLLTEHPPSPTTTHRQHSSSFRIHHRHPYHRSSEKPSNNPSTPKKIFHRSIRQIQNKPKIIIKQKETTKKLNIWFEERESEMKESVKQSSYPEHQFEISNSSQTPLQQSKPEKLLIKPQLAEIPEEGEETLRTTNLLAERKTKIQRKMIPHHIQISMGDRVQTIKQILNYGQNDKLHITIKPPSFFKENPDPFSPVQHLQFRARVYFEEMGRAPSRQEKVYIVRSDECLIAYYNTVYRRQICIIWYHDGSVYCGEVKDEMRSGLGMEWIPGISIYYGLYRQNSREGYGMMKYNNEKVYVGMWSMDHYNGFGKIFNRQGQMIESGNYRNSSLKIVGDFKQLI